MSTGAVDVDVSRRAILELGFDRPIYWEYIDSVINNVSVTHQDRRAEDILREHDPTDMDALLDVLADGCSVPDLWGLISAANRQLRYRVIKEAETLVAEGASRLALAAWWDRIQTGCDEDLGSEAAEVLGYTEDQLYRAMCWFSNCPPQKRLTPIHAHVHRLAQRDGWRCGYCGRELACSCDAVLPIAQAVSDHVMPRSRGGGDEDANRVLACVSCNSSKRDMTPSEWGRPLWGWLS